MGFLSGSVTLQRLSMPRGTSGMFGEEDLEALRRHAATDATPCPLDEPRVGATAGDHVFDQDYQFGKNVVGDCLLFGSRIDSQQIPGGLKRAWMQWELNAARGDDATRKLSKADRDQAKENVQARCEQEASTGKYQRMQLFPCLWDGAGEELWFGGSSVAARERTSQLLESAFDTAPQPITSGELARSWAESHQRTEQLQQIEPAVFHLEGPRQEIHWWNNHHGNFDFLGNEFLAWLWWRSESQGDAIRTLDDREVSVMFAKTLHLECPLGETGRESISAESPVQLPEAIWALASGKLPRKAGLALVCDGETYQLVLQAESFSVGSARWTPADGDARQSPEERIESLRSLLGVVDALYAAFCDCRLGAKWSDELRGIRGWIQSQRPPLRSAA